MYLSKHLILNFMEVMQIPSILTKQKSKTPPLKSSD